VFVYRLSDGRPFRHYVGAPVEHVIAHPVSPLVVLVTPRGLVRLHCYAHSLFAIESPWQPNANTALSQLVIGDAISLLGIADGDGELWHVPIGGVGSTVTPDAPEPAPAEPALVTAADKLRAMRESAPHPAPVVSPKGTGGSLAYTPPISSRAQSWRDGLASYGQELARGVDGELPIVAVDTELGDLAHRMGLSAIARRCVTALYALHLDGETPPSIARLARRFDCPVVGVRVVRLGRTSVVFGFGMFVAGAEEIASHGEWAQVYIDRETRRPVPMPDVVRAHLEDAVARRPVLAADLAGERA
jgi:hypothetical protein